MQPRFTTSLVVLVALLLLLPSVLLAKNPYRNTWFGIYPGATGTQLDDLPSNAGHCGVCHFDFDGGGPRNPYGLGVEVGLKNGLTNTTGHPGDRERRLRRRRLHQPGRDHRHRALRATRRPSPGSRAANVGSALNVPLAEVAAVPDAVGRHRHDAARWSWCTRPNGGEIDRRRQLDWSIDLHGDRRQRHLARRHLPLRRRRGDASSSVGQEPGAERQLLLVRAQPARQREPDPGGGAWTTPATRASDDSDADFTINAAARRARADDAARRRHVRDPAARGRDPGRSRRRPASPATATTTRPIEPWAQLARQHDGAGRARSALLRLPGRGRAGRARRRAISACAATRPGGWQEGRSVDTSGGMLTAKDRQGVQCDFCHRAVDRDYVPGVSPAAGRGRPRGDLAAAAAVRQRPVHQRPGAAASRALRRRPGQPTTSWSRPSTARRTSAAPATT